MHTFSYMKTLFSMILESKFFKESNGAGGSGLSDAAVQAKIDAELAGLTGQFIGTATTLAGLPSTDVDLRLATEGDWTILTVDDGINLAGIYSFDGTNYVFKAPLSGSNDRIFIDNTSVSPALTGTPTDVEIKVVSDANGYTNTILFYTGTDIATDGITHVFHVDKSGNVTVLKSEVVNPDRVHIDVVTLGPLSDSPEPTIAEVTTFIGTKRNVFAYYTGTNTATDTPLYTYNVDNSGNVTRISEDRQVKTFFSTSDAIAMDMNKYTDVRMSAFSDNPQNITLTNVHQGRSYTMTLNNNRGVDVLFNFLPAIYNGSNILINGLVVKAGTYKTLHLVGGSSDQVIILGDGSIAKNRVLADITTLAPVDANSPTNAELITFLGKRLDTVVLYTGTDVIIDPVKLIYHIDALQNITLIRDNRYAPGLRKRGTLISDIDLGEGLYNVDATSGIFDFNLPIATGSQKRYIFNGTKVNANNVTIKVSAGQELNGTTNGTFVLDTDGAVYLATDMETIGWRLVKLGAGIGGDIPVTVTADASDIISWDVSTVKKAILLPQSINTTTVLASGVIRGEHYNIEIHNDQGSAVTFNLPTSLKDINLNAIGNITLQSDDKRWFVFLGTSGGDMIKIADGVPQTKLLQQSVTTNTTLTSWNQTIRVDTALGNTTITLPTNVGSSGDTVEIIKTSADLNTVAISGSGAETVSGFSTVFLERQNQSMILRSNGTNSYGVGGLDDNTAGLTRKNLITSPSVTKGGYDYYLNYGSTGTFTLPSSTGELNRIYVNNVDGNSYTISPVAGQSINGILNGTYVTSTLGERILIVERNNGNWLVSNTQPASTGLLRIDTLSDPSPASGSGDYYLSSVVPSTFTLPASTGSTEQIHFHNELGNNCTIQLTSASDKLDGTVNGTILSNVAGEHIIFSDNAIGEYFASKFVSAAPAPVLLNQNINNTSSFATSNINFVNVGSMALTVPIGTHRLDYSLVGTIDNGESVQVGIAPSGGAILPESTATLYKSGGAGYLNATLTGTAFVTVAVSTTYVLQMRSPNSSGIDINYVNTGNNSFSSQQLSF